MVRLRWVLEAGCLEVHCWLMLLRAGMMAEGMEAEIMEETEAAVEISKVQRDENHRFCYLRE